ncbi:MAG: hypothetical protein ACSHYA_05715 [Opitutaceae bacterium]
MTILKQGWIGALFGRVAPVLACFLLLIACIGQLSANEGDEDVSVSASTKSILSVEQQTYRQVIESLDPMDLEGVSADVAEILSDYYTFNFTGADRWAEVQSIQFEGLLRRRGDQVDFVATKKKPDLCKIVLSKSGRSLATLAFDGQDAWQSYLAKGNVPVSMSEDDTSNFIRDAITGGNLFYARLPGKTIELKGTKVVAGRRCHELLVTLASGEQVTYMLGVLDLREYQQIAYNSVTGKREVTTHLEYENFEGVRFPVLSEMRVDGELLHTVEVHDLQFNRGFTPWMFSREAGGGGRVSSTSGDSDEEVETPSPDQSSSVSSNPFAPFAPPSVFGDANSGSSDGLGSDFSSPSGP